jgi:hypothetical protein
MAMTKTERAAYMRGYRKTVEPLKEREARNEGFKAGVGACVKFVKNRDENEDVDENGDEETGEDED